MPDVQQASHQRIALVIDRLSLRRAGVMAVLGAWADANGVLLLDTTADDLEANASKPVGMTIINFGGCRLREPGARELIDSIKGLLGDVRLAVIADSEDVDDVSEAFSRGVHGYIPTSTRPEVALSALSFILSGGSYFPPSILFSAVRRSLKIRAALPRRNAAVDDNCDWLSSSQRRIIELLRSGRSNKMIARDLNICEATVKAQLRVIMRRLSLVSRTQVAIYFANKAAAEDDAALAAAACEEAEAASSAVDGPMSPEWEAAGMSVQGADVASPAIAPALGRHPGAVHRPV